MNGTDISIIIATRNREEILLETVRKACLAIEDTNAEIIVVNDGNRDLKLPKDILEKIKLFNNPKSGVASARNFGVDNAKGFILFFVDDDMWINREIINWINQFVIKLKKADAVYNINWKYPETLTEKLLNSKIGQYILSNRYNSMWGRMHEKGEEPKDGLHLFNIVSSCSLIISKKIFDTIGKYNEAMIFQGEDIDLSNKLNALSIPIYCVFDITLHHNHQDRLKINSFLKRDSDGYESEFKAVKSGIIKPHSDTRYSGIKKIMFDGFSATENIWIIFLKLIPNKKIFTSLNNKIIGALGSLQRYKQWAKILGKDKKSNF